MKSAPFFFYLWSSGGRWSWEGVGDEEDGREDGGGIATGTQKRGSKQGEALTSDCFTLERKRERGGGEAHRRRGERDRTKSRTKGRNGTNSREEEHRGKQCVTWDVVSEHSHKEAAELGEKKLPLTRLRVAVKRLRREVTTVPLRLRPICLRFSPSSGSAPKRRSRNIIGC